MIMNDGIERDKEGSWMYTRGKGRVDHRLHIGGREYKKGDGIFRNRR